MVTACTIIARNRLAHARVLADSFLAHHSDGVISVLVIDDEARTLDHSGEPFRGLRLGDIGLDRAEITRLATIYDDAELVEAVKPVLLRHLLTGETDVIYLDPDIEVHDSLEEISRLSRQHSLVLTPYATSPLPVDGRGVDESHLLLTGVFNLGVIGVAPEGRPFVDWWSARARRGLRTDSARKAVDLRWFDLAPCFFDHVILSHPGYAVSCWNLHASEMTIDENRYLVGGTRLKMFHFTGFDPQTPFLLSTRQGDRPRILLSQNTAVARLCGAYCHRLVRAGLVPGSTCTYGWGVLNSGLPLSTRIRRIYRQSLEAHERGDGAEPPNPFLGKEEDFVEWLNEPVPTRLRRGVSRYLYSIYVDRADVQAAFPDLAGNDRAAFLYWASTEGLTQERIPAKLLQPQLSSVRSEDSNLAAAQTTEGVNIAGHFRAEVGIGQAARQLLSALQATDIPHSILTYGDVPSRQAHPFCEPDDHQALHAVNDVNIVCLNANQTATFARDVGPRFFAGRHTAGYWFWELEHFPSAMHHAFDYVDEVWTATEFVAAAVRASGRRPVFTVPLPLPIVECGTGVRRKDLQLPEGFMFLFMFDFFSVFERKNPIGLIEAFCRAFRPGEGPFLVIKAINGDARLPLLEKLRAAAADRSDVIIIDKYWLAQEKNDLLGLCDCYVSLHRSEGLGLTMAEAMGLEKPVIATGYSGNLHFMTVDNSYLVGYVTQAVPVGCSPYPEGVPWADPDLDHAAECMRRVFDRPDEAVRKAQQARQDILTKHNLQTTSAVLIKRLESIRRAPRTLAEALPSSNV